MGQLPLEIDSGYRSTQRDEEDQHRDRRDLYPVSMIGDHEAERSASHRADHQRSGRRIKRFDETILDLSALLSIGREARAQFCAPVAEEA